MGRFEKRSENLRASDIFTEADTVLRVVTEELQIIQRTVLKSLQEDIKRLQSEKLRLADDVKHLQQDKEELLQGRQLSDLQVLLHQLANVLANHISSQLQSSLETLAKQALEQANKGNEKDKAAAERLLGSLDDTLTITFNTLQQEVKNYQNNLSRQLVQMSNQQQQGEELLAELVNRLRGELMRPEMEKTIQKAPQQSPPTVIQSIPFPPPVEEPIEQQHSNHFDDVTEIQIKSFPEYIAPQIHPPQEFTEDSSLSVEEVLLESETLSESDLDTSIDASVSEKLPTAEYPPIEPTSVSSVPEELLPENEIASESDIDTSVPEETSVSISTWMDNTSLPPITVRPLPKKETKSAVVDTLRPEPPNTTVSPRVRTDAISPMGLLLIVLSTAVISLYSVAVKIIFNPSSLIFGVFTAERLLLPTFGNALLILMLRMLVVVPLMLVLAPILHPQVWQELQSLLESSRSRSSTTKAQAKQVLLLSIVSGCFLFLSQVLIYIAISQITTGMAVTLLFIYPAISGLLAWSLLRDQPTSLRFGAIASIFIGQMLVLAADTSIGTGNTVLGSITAIISGVAFAFYVILTRICAAKLHPVSFTLINFAIMLLLSFVGLILPLPTTWSLQVDSSKILELILSAFILGVLTLFGYVFNNIGIRKLGATRSAILGATVPALTVIFAGLIIQETLQPAQVLGVLFVTGGAAAIGYEKMRTRIRNSKPSN